MERNPAQLPSLAEIAPLLDAAREAATAYYELTGKPLGITGEIGEYEAAKLLGLTLAPARTAGYDAIGPDGRHIQIKARMFGPGKPLGGQRMGSIKADSEFDTVMLVMLGKDYQPWVIWEATREAVLAALSAPGSVSRNERGALAVAKFKNISAVAWHR